MKRCKSNELNWIMGESVIAGRAVRCILLRMGHGSERDVRWQFACSWRRDGNRKMSCSGGLGDCSRGQLRPEAIESRRGTRISSAARAAALGRAQRRSKWRDVAVSVKQGHASEDGRLGTIIDITGRNGEYRCHSIGVFIQAGRRKISSEHSNGSQKPRCEDPSRRFHVL